MNNLNEVSATTSSTYTYDGNGNRSTRSDNGTARYTYDDENQLVEVDKDPATYSSPPRTDFVYDGLMRLRKRTEYTWSSISMSWVLNSETRYIYDGMTVVQELNSSNVPTVSYTHGNDLSGSLQGAGGIGGLLARSSGYSAGSWSTHNFYHADGNGNITALVDSTQTLSATYKYDPFGKTISSSGTMATPNVYRFSPKEYHAPSDMYYYGYRWYDPTLQRWLNRDPIEEDGGVNLYSFLQNASLFAIDFWGLDITVDPTAPKDFQDRWNNALCKLKTIPTGRKVIDDANKKRKNITIIPGGKGDPSTGRSPTNPDDVVIRVDPNDPNGLPPHHKLRNKNTKIKPLLTLRSPLDTN